VFRSTDARRRFKELGLLVPANSIVKHKIMGKEFDPARIEAYQNRFAISAS
jgi:nitrate/nitrite transport system substrate-binding protein